MCALDAAANAGNLKCLEKLLQLGADPNARGGINHYAPIHASAVAGTADCMSALLRAGAERSAVDSSGHTALFLSARAGHTACVRALLQAAGGGSPRPPPAGGGAAEPAYSSLRSIFCDFDQSLHAAASGGHVEIIHLLADAGADLDVQLSWSNDDGFFAATPLSEAVDAGQCDAVAALLLRGAGRAPSGTGETPLSSVMIDDMSVEMRRRWALRFIFGQVPLLDADSQQVSTDLLTDVLEEARSAADILQAGSDQFVSSLTTIRAPAAGVAGGGGADALARLESLRSLRHQPVATINAGAGARFSKGLLDVASAAIRLRECAELAEPEVAFRTVLALEQWRRGEEAATAADGGACSSERNRRTYAAARCVAKWADVTATLREARRAEVEMAGVVARALDRSEAVAAEMTKNLDAASRALSAAFARMNEARGRLGAAGALYDSD